MCRAIGFKVDVSGVLPDLILADLGEKNPVITFVECVASDGPVNDRRKQELSRMACEANYREEDCIYVTVFKDRSYSVSRKLTPSVAWGTFIWYNSEPDEIIFLHEGKGRERYLLKTGRYTRYKIKKESSIYYLFTTFKI